MKFRQFKFSWNIGLHLVIVASILSLITLIALSITPTQAALNLTFTVEYTFDAGDISPGDTHCDASYDPGYQCTLRAAIDEANTLAGEQEIHINAGTYVLTGAAGDNDNCTGDLDIKDDVITVTQLVNITQREMIIFFKS